MTTKRINYNELENGKFVVVILCSDGYLSVGIDGNYTFDTLKEAYIVANNHKDIDENVEVRIFNRNQDAVYELSLNHNDAKVYVQA